METKRKIDIELADEHLWATIGALRVTAEIAHSEGSCNAAALIYSCMTQLESARAILAEINIKQH